MDSEGWASLLSTKKRLASPSDQPVNYGDFEGDNDALLEFLCPFCYVDFDVGALCSHLEEEHCSDSRSVACPICAARTGSDIVGHIMQQHQHLLKMQRRRRVRKSSPSLSSPSASFSLDPLLSSLLRSLTIPESEMASSVASKEASIKSSLLSDQKFPSLGSLGTEDCEENLEEAASRAKFVEQMVLSTIFRDA